MKLHDVTLDDKYALEQGDVFLTGVQALVRLPLDQRRRDRAAGLDTAGFISGYRGSPLGGYDQQLHAAAAFLDANDITLEEGINEDLGATAVWGSQMVGLTPGARHHGVFGVWYGKAPGVDRTGDVFKHANFSGVSRYGGVVAIAGDDPNCKSSTLPSQSEFAFADAEIPVLNPSSIQEVLDYGLIGFALSRFAGVWTGLVALADTMDAGSVISVDHDRFGLKEPEVLMPPEGLHIRPHDAPLEKERRMRLYKLPAVKAFVRANRLDRVILHPKAKRARVGIIASGQAARDVFEALDAMGLSPERAAEMGLAVYKVAMPWPLEPEGVRDFCEGLETVLVAEHKRGLIESQVKEALYATPANRRPSVIGKTDAAGRPLLPDTGSIAIPTLAKAIHDLLPPGPHQEGALAYFHRVDAARKATDRLHAAQARAPHYCSGCPHNTSTTKLPEGSRALAGIGCHYMATWITPNTDFHSQMGGEGVAWIGQAPFTDENHVFVNLGDGTYSHSGSLAIRAAVAADVNITYKILYNDAVAMTGGQHVDMAGIAPAQILRQVLGEGVKQAVVVTEDPSRYDHVRLPKGVKVHHRRELLRVEEALKETPGVTVLLYDQMCATERRRKRKRGKLPEAAKKIFINPDVCEGCGDCSAKSNCLSVEPLETELGRKRAINQSSCNQDYSCVEGFCPSFVSIYGAELVDKTAGGLKVDGAALPTPSFPTIEDTWNVIFTGVGGTGVTTVAAILGMAAYIDGRAATTLDMTGLAQKGGAVLSHLRLARNPDAIRSSRIPPASADALIACDLVVATSPEALMLASAERTHAVVNRDVMPTSEFITDRNVLYDGTRMDAAVTQASNLHDGLDADRIAAELMGDDIYANMIMAGFAWQKGLVPISSRAIYRAIKLNGVKAEDNQTAFDLGRLAAHDPEKVAAMLPERAPQGPAEFTLAELIAHRERLLTDYWGPAYATRYRTLVQQVRLAEEKLDLGEDLTRAVAKYAAKLMAYKDEYEVARLYTNGDFAERIKATFTGGRRMTVHLAPPILAPKDKLTGAPRKREFGRWMFWGFALLARVKGLRETPFDLFGRTAERRLERAIRDDYFTKVRKLAGELSPENHRLAVRIAEVPDQIRGFGHVKEKSLETAEAYEARLWEKWPGGGESAPRAVAE